MWEPEKDGLTGVPKRSEVFPLFEGGLAQAKATGTVLTVALVDLDHFKKLNDTYGHTAGDDTLVAVARAMVECAPAGTLVGRYGGEEFILLLPGVEAAQARETLDLMREAVAAVRVPFGTGADAVELEITLSGGMASYPVSGTTMEDLLHKADEALYEAKVQGRNRVVADAAA